MVSAAEQLAANLNFGAFSKAEELKRRIWFTLAALLVFRFGTFVPIPGKPGQYSIEPGPGFQSPGSELS